MYFVDPSKKRIDIEINSAQDFCHSFVLPEVLQVKIQHSSIFILKINTVRQTSPIIRTSAFPDIIGQRRNALKRND
jgi:hypothetical protein